MTTTRVRWIRLGAAVGALALITAGCAGDDDTPVATDTTATTAEAPAGPSIAISSPASGTTAKGNTVSLALDITGISVVKADGDTTGKTGHIHAFIDREPVAAGAPIPKEAGIVHSADNPLVLTGLSPGAHKITVVLGDGAHVRLGDASDVVNVTVEGPTLDATAPATAKLGSPVRIEFKVDGVTIVKADGDTSGKTGHFHVFVDRPLPKAGDLIEKPADGSILHTADSFVDVPNLTAGEHTFFVVLGDGAHTALGPLVADKVTVVVS
ncbi:MAG: DUF4399 domain-containing protein [Acidimicrobiales bacterium]|nr:DUF4399 domain-containing protein [Acidimicrobiales bacterium]